MERGLARPGSRVDSVPPLTVLRSPPVQIGPDPVTERSQDRDRAQNALGGGATAHASTAGFHPRDDLKEVLDISVQAGSLAVMKDFLHIIAVGRRRGGG